jgi:hypothetical protein
MIEIKKLAEIHQLSIVGRDDITVQMATSLENQTPLGITWVKKRNFSEICEMWRRFNASKIF